MKFSMLITLFSILVFATACGQYGNEEYYNEPYGNSAYDNNAQNQNSYHAENTQNRGVSSSSGELIMQPILESKTGRPAFYVPLPNSWKVTNTAWVGTNKNKVTFYQGITGMIQQGGFQSIDQVIRQKIEPAIRQQNATITEVYDLPNVAQRNQVNFSQLWKVGASQDGFEVKGIEIKDSKGEKGLMILTFMISKSQMGSYSSYYFHMMEAAPADFDKAKKEVIYALANLQPDRQHVANYNRNEQMKSQQSWNVHNQRMARNQSNFNNWQKTQNTLSEVGDIYHQTWKNTSDMNNAGHSKTIDGIHNQNTMTNPHTGQNVQVDHGYNQYYMNQDNEWIGTNDAFYNPQNDQNINYQNWEEVQYDNYYDNY